MNTGTLNAITGVLYIFDYIRVFKISFNWYQPKKVDKNEEKEYDIFRLLLENQNRMFICYQIHKKGWGDFSCGGKWEMIDFYIRNLRKKLFDAY